MDFFNIVMAYLADWQNLFCTIWGTTCVAALFLSGSAAV